MKHQRLSTVLAAAVVAAVVLALVIRSHFERDLSVAAERAAQGSEVIATRCGPIEVQQAGQGMPLLVVHGSGGGHDQGMAWARPLVQQGVRVIAMSRFGYCARRGPPMPRPRRRPMRTSACSTRWASRAPP